VKIKHGMNATKPYYIWGSMKGRCYNKNNQRYKNYGARGIRVCDRWKNSFINFWEDMKDGYREGLTIDRIDNNGNYCKENCRWSTPTEQNRNKTNTIFIEYKGVKKRLTQWAKELGINENTLRSRYLYNWDVKKMLSTKLYSRSKTAKRRID